MNCYFVYIKSITKFLHLLYVHLDMVIGFNQSRMSFEEPNRLLQTFIFLVKENNQPTEQTFHIQINFINSLQPATRGYDFTLPGFAHSNEIVVRLLPNMETASRILILFPDEIVESTEGFILEVSSFERPAFTVPSPFNSVFRQIQIFIIDNDRKLCS